MIKDQQAPVKPLPREPRARSRYLTKELGDKLYSAYLGSTAADTGGSRTNGEQVYPDLESLYAR